MNPQPLNDENYINSIIEQPCPVAVLLKEIKDACEADEELKLVKEGLYNCGFVCAESWKGRR